VKTVCANFEPVLRSPRTGQVCARHALDHHHVEPTYEHRAPGQIRATSERGWVVVDIGADQMIGDDVLQLLEPPQAQLREDLALIRDCRRQHHVERAHAVAGHHD
jgi:hypothetical protein